jgi:hypothetical protein
MHIIWGALCIVSLQNATAIPVQWSPELGGNGHYYEVFVNHGGISWEQEYLDAIQRGGYLVTITSPSENNFFYSLIQAPEYWFVDGYGFYRGPTIGGIQTPGATEPGGGWGWVTGETFTYASWAPGQPNDVRSQDRIEFWNASHIAPTWQDVSQYASRPPISWGVEWNSAPPAVPDRGYTGALLLAGLVGIKVVRKCLAKNAIVLSRVTIMDKA